MPVWAGYTTPGNPGHQCASSPSPRDLSPPGAVAPLPQRPSSYKHEPDWLVGYYFPPPPPQGQLPSLERSLPLSCLLVPVRTVLIHTLVLSPGWNGMSLTHSSEQLSEAPFPGRLFTQKPVRARPTDKGATLRTEVLGSLQTDPNSLPCSPLPVSFEEWASSKFYVP